jgi:hypothetical protein
MRLVMVIQAPDRGSVSSVPLGEVRQVVARIILVAFVITFMAARVLVFLIVSVEFRTCSCTSRARISTI